MKQQKTVTIQVKGAGDTRQKALADALGSIQRVILQGTENLILRIQPVDVEVLEAKVKRKREKFLFFFFPRTREHYSVVLNVTLDVTLLDIEHLQFQSVDA
ncbi:MAG: DUF4312 family protein [Enterobacteriaceae bacterium]